MDSYSVSLVDGYNLPVVVAPQGAATDGGDCVTAGCAVDLNGACPAELRAVVACKSACQAFGSPQYCCTGREYGNPDKCKPTSYSELFKSACPRAYTYAYDGAGSNFTFSGGGDTTYAIRFCPKTTSSVKAKPPTTSSPNSQQPETANQPLINGSTTTTQYTGGGSSSQVVALIAGVLTVVAGALIVLAKCLGLFKICCGEPSRGALPQERLGNTG